MSDDTPLIEQCAVELDAKAATPMDLTCQPYTVFQLTGLVQLACRHPGVTNSMRATADTFLAAVREYFSDCPGVLDVIRRGDDPDEDR